MDLRPELQINTAIKALTDTILPAVDPANRLAQEQAKLVIGVLRLVAQRQPLMYRYDLDELARSLALADTLQQQAQAHTSPETAAALHALARSAEAGADVLDRARAEPGELTQANVALRETTGALISVLCAQAPCSDLKPISSTVMAHAKEQLLRERVWLLAQGWEADPKALPSIESLIGEGPATL